MKMTPTEKDFLNKIAVISAKDVSTVRDVLRAILKSVTMELMCKSDKFIIPYLCEFKIEHYEKIRKKRYVETVVKLRAKPSQTLVNEITAVSEGEVSPTGNYIKNQIMKTFQNLLELSTEEMEEFRAN